MSRDNMMQTALTVAIAKLGNRSGCVQVSWLRFQELFVADQTYCSRQQTPSPGDRVGWLDRSG